VEPPDLRRFPDFKLPGLYGTNIVRGDFFAPAFPWPESQFEWIVGNPPWVSVTPKNLPPDQKLAFAWMSPRQDSHPTGGWQLAEGFLWKTLEHLHPDGAAGMLAPAMSLFKSRSERFRAAFFSEVPVWCVANFANLTYLLFARRAKSPAAALFFRARGESDDVKDILSYAPFVVNQPTLQNGRCQLFREAWTLAINRGELRRVDRVDAERGDALTWKLAMWGSSRDRRVLERVTRCFPGFRQFIEKHGMLAHQGIELRPATAKEPIVFIEELVGKPRLIMERLRGRGRLYNFPVSAFDKVGRSMAYVRQGRADAPLQVCRPPHIVVDESRRWAIYSAEFLIIPHPQLGISAKRGQEMHLKAMALYLVSDFVTYHQFFCAEQMGVQKSVAVLKTLMALPMPLDDLSPDSLCRWADVYDELVETLDHSRMRLLLDVQTDLWRLEQRANDLVYSALGLSEDERWLVDDFVHSRRGLVHGKLGDDDAAKRPNDEILVAYAHALCQTLDTFVGRTSELRHRIEIWQGNTWGAVMIEPARGSGAAHVKLQPASRDLEYELGQLGTRLRREHTYWLYFDRGLTIFDGDRVVLVKPMQRLHWLRSQALQDADNLIADALAAKEPVSWH